MGFSIFYCFTWSHVRTDRRTYGIRSNTTNRDSSHLYIKKQTRYDDYKSRHVLTSNWFLVLDGLCPELGKSFFLFRPRSCFVSSYRRLVGSSIIHRKKSNFCKFKLSFLWHWFIYLALIVKKYYYIHLQGFFKFFVLLLWI